MAWDKDKIVRENGDIAEAQAPVIISASRSTDIPAFYADWFFHRLEKGYSAWTNPFNGVKSFVSYKNTRFIVFWSKNPKPLIPYLKALREKGIRCYIQYTLNDYEQEGLETGVPSLEDRIRTFKSLVAILGKGAVIWRFDPLLLTDRITIDDLISKINAIGRQLADYTEKLVFSFADIVSYRKVKTNLETNGINYLDWSECQMKEFVQKLAEANRRNGWNFDLCTCGEKPIFKEFGVQPNHCVDDNLMIRLSYDDKTLMDFLGVTVCDSHDSLFGPIEIPSDAIILPNGQYAIKSKNNKDKGQRKLCGCMVSKDIGEYNTCAHLCEYCYANTSKSIACANLKRHKDNPLSETITGL